MKRAVTVYVLILHVVLAMLVFDYVMTRPTIADKKWFANLRAFHTRVDKQMPSDSILFFGDSHIQGFCQSCVAYPSANFGMGKATTVQVLDSLLASDALDRAKAVVIQTGHNDLAGDQEPFESAVKHITDLLAGTPTIWYRQFPVAQTKERDAASTMGLNEHKQQFNSVVSRHCKPENNCYFVSISRKLSTQTHSLAASYHIGDGVHLNSQGYRLWALDITEQLRLRALSTTK